MIIISDKVININISVGNNVLSDTEYTAEVGEGVVTITYTPVTNASITVNASFDGDDLYQSSTLVTKTFDVSIMNSSISSYFNKSIH